MTARSGLGLVDIVALEAVFGLQARPDRPRLKAARLVAAVDDATGLGPDPVYHLLCEHGRRWVTPLRLLDFQGNIGSPDDGPAGPRYVEARLSPPGKLVVDSEQGRIAPVPVGLIIGNTHRGGSRPPFAAQRITSALQALFAQPHLTDRQLLELVGPPVFPSDCEIDGDLDRLAGGQPTAVTLRARMQVVGETPPRVRIDRLPPGIGPQLAATTLARLDSERSREARLPEVAKHVISPIGEITNSSSGTADRLNIRIECTGRPGTTTTELLDYLRTTWILGTNLVLELAAPLPTLLRQWVTNHRNEDIEASLQLLAEAD